MALSVSCCFDLDIGSFFTSRSTNLVIPKGHKRARIKRNTEAHLDDGLRPHQSQRKRSECSFMRGKDEHERSRDQWFCCCSPFGPARCRLSSHSFKNNHMWKHTQSGLWLHKKRIIAPPLNRHTHQFVLIHCSCLMSC